MLWPEAVYSLSHIAIPIPATDPLYGLPSAGGGPNVSLGRLAFYGERGLLRIPASDQLRQRWNPFYPYLRARVHGFMDLEQTEAQ